MVRTVMLTGATGYLGRHVLHELLRRDWKVRALVRDPRRLPQGLPATVTAVAGDLVDAASVESAARGADAIVHVGALSADWWPDPDEFRRVNVFGTEHVLRAARTVGAGRVVVTSSALVLGPTDGLGEGDESLRPPPGGFSMEYQRTKAEAAEICRQVRGPDLDVIITYPAALYGSGVLTHGNYIAHVMEMLRKGRYPCLPAFGDRRLTLSHVEDVARGTVAALERGAPAGEYILGGPTVTLRAFFEAIARELPLARLPPRLPGPLVMAGLGAYLLPYVVRHVRPPISWGGLRALLRSWSFTSARAERELGYTWRSFDEGFPPFVRWYRGIVS